MATLVIDTDLESKLAVEEFTPGYLFRLEPGESVPLDAVILTGSGFFDETNITKNTTRLVKTIFKNMVENTELFDSAQVKKAWAVL